jgi:hypothetical protein
MAKKKNENEEAAAPAVKVVEPPKPSKVKIPKLASKNKSRLPRKQKKALKKANQ